MKYLLTLIALCLFSGVGYSYQSSADTYYCESTIALGLKQEFGVKVDSLVLTDEYTRVYGSVIGKPHTSAKIMDITLVNNGSMYTATDVEGFDLKRWFQWEDSGVIPMEIDFMPIKKAKQFMLIFKTPASDMKWNVNCKLKKQ